MKKNSTAIGILFTTLMLISCGVSTQPAPNDISFKDIKQGNWNTSIKLRDDPALSNSYKNGEDLTLRVENLSDIPIVFPENFGTIVMVKDGQNWVNIQNDFYNSGSQYLPIKKSYPLGLLVTTMPYISNLSSPTTIRIVIIGHREDNDKELLGAYFDANLNP
jgi:hypothetical protein